MFGTVYKSLDLMNNNYVALKKIRNYTEIKNSLNEIIIPLQMNHETIVKVLDYYYDDSSLNIIMPLYTGPDLHTYINQVNNIRYYNQLNIFYNMVVPLTILQKNNIAHLDVKLENYVYDNNNKLVLIDFGSSKKILEKNSLTKIDYKAGTEVYLAPEVLENHIHLNSDSWSLGVSMITMLTLEKPTMDNGIIAVDDNLNNIHGSIPDNLFDIIESTLTLDPLTRINMNTINKKLLEIIT